MNSTTYNSHYNSRYGAQINAIQKEHLPCPVCGFQRLIDVVVGVKTELVPESEIQPGWVPDVFQKCKICKNQIGIKKVS